MLNLVKSSLTLFMADALDPTMDHPGNAVDIGELLHVMPRMLPKLIKLRLKKPQVLRMMRTKLSIRLKDEFCPDESFVEKAASTLDKEEDCDLVEKIVVTNDEVHQKVTEKDLQEKLLSIGIEAERIESVQVDHGKSKVVVKVRIPS